MKFYNIKNTQHLPISLEEAWAFFSSPNNLEQMTPSYMDFTVTSNKAAGEIMFEGQIITYVLKPVLGIPIKWMTEITHVKYPHYFIDEQRFGPYSMWHHKHTFTPTDNGVEVHDEIDYVIPLGFLGTFAHKLFVRKKLEFIIEHRRKVLSDLFPSSK